MVINLLLFISIPVAVITFVSLMANIFCVVYYTSTFLEWTRNIWNYLRKKFIGYPYLKDKINKLLLEENENNYQIQNISKEKGELAFNYIKANFPELSKIFFPGHSPDLLIIKASCLKTLEIEESKSLYIFIKNLDATEQNKIANWIIKSQEELQEESVVINFLLYIKDKQIDIKKAKFDNGIFDTFCTVFSGSNLKESHRNTYANKFFELVNIFGTEFIKDNAVAVQKMISNNELFSQFNCEIQTQTLHVAYNFGIHKNMVNQTATRMKFWILQNYDLSTKKKLDRQIVQTQFYHVNELVGLIGLNKITEIKNETIKTIVSNPDKVTQILSFETSRQAFIKNPNDFNTIQIPKHELNPEQFQYITEHEMSQNYSFLTHSSDKHLLTIKNNLIQNIPQLSKKIYLYIKKYSYENKEKLAQYSLNFPTSATFLCWHSYEKKVQINCKSDTLYSFESVLKNCKEQIADKKSFCLFSRTQKIINLLGDEFVQTFGLEISRIVKNDAAYKKFNVMVKNYSKIITSSDSYKTISLPQWRVEFKFWLLLAAFFIEKNTNPQERKIAFANTNTLLKTVRSGLNPETVMLLTHDKLKYLAQNPEFIKENMNNYDEIMKFIGYEQKNSQREIKSNCPFMLSETFYLEI